MTNEIKVSSVKGSPIEGTWITGTVGGTLFEVCVYEKADEDYNYNGGKIAHLSINKPSQKDYTAFSRGFFDGDAPKADLKAKFEAIVNKYNN